MLDVDAVGPICAALAAGRGRAPAAGALRRALVARLAEFPEAQGALARELTSAAHWRELLGDALVASGATRDREVLAAARAVLDAGGSRYTMDIRGAGNVQAGDGNIQIGKNLGAAAQQIHGPVTINQAASSHSESGLGDNYGAVGTFYGPVSIRVRHSALGAATGLLLTAVLLVLAALVWRAADDGPIGWGSLPDFGLAMRPTWWACLVPFAIGVTQSAKVGTATPALRMISTVTEHVLGWPAVFALLVVNSPHRYRDHWYTSADAVAFSNGVNDFLQRHFFADAPLFTSAYVCLFAIGAVSGLVAGAIERLKAEARPVR
ncbi:hypothetical protein ACPPVO_01460 [Dactylosporangium sp. McL0621]|uniref:hypothetical protein n=1 Tax=Dactylosporangium sp. McL0621 TaxID=3415678 RepID=UPI003CF207FB